MYQLGWKTESRREHTAEVAGLPTPRSSTPAAGAGAVKTAPKTEPTLVRQSTTEFARPRKILRINYDVFRGQFVKGIFGDRNWFKFRG